MGLAGAGLLAVLTGEHLHPPMVRDSSVWADGARWAEGAAEHSRQVAEFAGLNRGENVLDIGCGIGGPARLWASEFGVRVSGVSISATQIRTARRLSEQAGLKSVTRFECEDCRSIYSSPLFERQAFDCVISLNMLYHIEQKTELLKQLRTGLSERGRIVIDDWMITPDTGPEDIRRLGRYFVSPHFACSHGLTEQLDRAGFRLNDRQDLTDVALGPMTQYFSRVLERDFGDRIRAFDYGEEMLHQFTEAVEFTLELYRTGRLRYQRMLASA